MINTPLAVSVQDADTNPNFDFLLADHEAETLLEMVSHGNNNADDISIPIHLDVSDDMMVSHGIYADDLSVPIGPEVFDDKMANFRTSADDVSVNSVSVTSCGINSEDLSVPIGPNFFDK